MRNAAALAVALVLLAAACSDDGSNSTTSGSVPLATVPDPTTIPTQTTVPSTTTTTSTTTPAPTPTTTAPAPVEPFPEEKALVGITAAGWPEEATGCSATIELFSGDFLAATHTAHCINDASSIPFAFHVGSGEYRIRTTVSWQSGGNTERRSEWYPDAPFRNEAHVISIDEGTTANLADHVVNQPTGTFDGTFRDAVTGAAITDQWVAGKGSVCAAVFEPDGFFTGLVFDNRSNGRYTVGDALNAGRYYVVAFDCGGGFTPTVRASERSYIDGWVGAEPSGDLARTRLLEFDGRPPVIPDDARLIQIRAGEEIDLDPMLHPVPVCEHSHPTVLGTTARDVLTATDAADVFVTMGGGDEIQGLGDDDTVCRVPVTNPIDIEELTYCVPGPVHQRLGPSIDYRVLSETTPRTTREGTGAAIVDVEGRTWVEVERGSSDAWMARWLLRAGNCPYIAVAGYVIVANPDGVGAYRNDRLIERPITSSVGLAFSDTLGGIVYQARPSSQIFRYDRNGDRTTLASGTLWDVTRIDDTVAVVYTKSSGTGANRVENLWVTWVPTQVDVKIGELATDTLTVTGASWTGSRFFYSAADDPTVRYGTITFDGVRQDVVATDPGFVPIATGAFVGAGSIVAIDGAQLVVFDLTLTEVRRIDLPITPNTATRVDGAGGIVIVSTGGHGYMVDLSDDSVVQLGWQGTGTLAE